MLTLKCLHPLSQLPALSFHVPNYFLMTYERPTKKYTRPGATNNKTEPVSMVTFVWLVSSVIILFGTVTTAIYITVIPENDYCMFLFKCVQKIISAVFIFA